MAKQLLPSRTKNLGILLLNNPRALHALTREMVDLADEALRDWTARESGVKAILIESSREGLKRPSFCAGGDVKTVYERGLAVQRRQQQRQQQQQQRDGDGLPSPSPEDFFRSEYRVNHAIATSPIPIVSFWDGLVIGGGVGLSIHGRYRVATERTRFSMPECKIGFFPDVGSTWWMPRMLPGPVARYVALTGRSLGPADLLRTGLATHYVPSKNLDDLRDALANATATVAVPIESSRNARGAESDAIATVLASFHEPLPTEGCHLSVHAEDVRAAFSPGKHDADRIVEHLKHADTDFARETLRTLSKLSPTSLCVTLEGLKRGGKAATLADALAMEFTMAKSCLKPNRDFYEGVRSVLVDRDHSPEWNPPTLAKVKPGDVEEWFLPDDDDEDEWTPSTPTSTATTTNRKRKKTLADGDGKGCGKNTDRPQASKL